MDPRLRCLRRGLYSDRCVPDFVVLGWRLSSGRQALLVAAVYSRSNGRYANATLADQGGHPIEPAHGGRPLGGADACMNARNRGPVGPRGAPREASMYSGVTADRSVAPREDRYRVMFMPASDRLFCRTVSRHVRSVRQHRATLRSARRSLRQRYPDAELNRQRDGGIRGQSVELWFAYRDGRSEAILPLARWWQDRGLARVVVDGDGRLIQERHREARSPRAAGRRRCRRRFRQSAAHP